MGGNDTTVTWNSVLAQHRVLRQRAKDSAAVRGWLLNRQAAVFAATHEIPQSARAQRRAQARAQQRARRRLKAQAVRGQ